MNTLSDTLKDMLTDFYAVTTVKGDMVDYTVAEQDEIIEEYVERIKNELNVEKYLT